MRVILAFFVALALAGGAEAKPARAPATERTQPSATADEDHYVNVDGERVHRPVRAISRPPGASARCRDGSYSFSRHRRGTCSHHSGVAVWY
jgi:hypothetical protein